MQYTRLVNFFNTADVYEAGDSERMLGRALGARRKDVVIATKVGNRMASALIETGLSRRHLFAAAEGASNVWGPTISTSISRTKWTH